MTQKQDIQSVSDSYYPVQVFPNMVSWVPEAHFDYVLISECRFETSPLYLVDLVIIAKSNI